MGESTTFARNQEVFGQGEPAEYLYKVKFGCVRTYTTLSDGRRQIAAFYLPDDVFGLEARDEHSVSAEAIMRSRVRVIKKTVLMSRAADDMATLNHLLEITTAELQRTQTHILLLLKTAQERVVGFLIEMQNRQFDQSEVELPMSRQDIADYLGLTIETVSRTLTRLESASAISLPNTRSVVLRNRLELDRLNA